MTEKKLGLNLELSYDELDSVNGGYGETENPYSGIIPGSATNCPAFNHQEGFGIDNCCGNCSYYLSRAIGSNYWTCPVKESQSPFGSPISGR